MDNWCCARHSDKRKLLRLRRICLSVFVCFSKGTKLNFNQNNMEKICEIRIDELTTRKLWGRTLLAPSPIQDGAKSYNHDMPIDKCCRAPSASELDISYLSASSILTVYNPPISIAAPLAVPSQIPAFPEHDPLIFCLNTMAALLQNLAVALNGLVTIPYGNLSFWISRILYSTLKKKNCLRKCMLRKTSKRPSESLIQLNKRRLEESELVNKSEKIWTHGSGLKNQSVVEKLAKRRANKEIMAMC
jgi:hypothetical protein